MAERRHDSNGSVPVRAVVFDLFNTLTAPIDRSAYSSERDSWPGESIDALSELPGLITGTAAGGA